MGDQLTELLRAPFPWFGGKRRCVDAVWPRFGNDIANYVEPFFGSGAMLLGRPGGAGKIETVNDVDRYLANFWRAIQHDPEAVARHADWPVNEADMHARHLWLVNQTEFRERMHTDPDFYDAKIAGWWVWGICQWIGGGWCKVGVNPGRKRPYLTVFPTGDGNGKNAGMGIHATGFNAKVERTRPKMSGDSPGMGVHSEAAYSPGRRPTMTSAGMGVHLPSLGNDRGLNGVAAPPCLEWFLALQERLRRVRVACGDWKRVLGPSVLGKGKNVGGRRPCAVFLDPPYDHDLRNQHLYAEDDASIAERVREWAIEHGDDPDLRIALCGYDDGREMPKGWSTHEWKGARGYAREDNDNREKERIWFSPHCIAIGDSQRWLFTSMQVGS